MVSDEMRLRAIEGSGHQHAREFSRFLRIALNSTKELEYHLIAARDFRVGGDSNSLTLISQVIKVRKMLYGLLRHLASHSEERHGAPQRETTQA
jgi:S23 ribosomal protein.